MSLKKQRKRLNSKSPEIQKILVERLNKLCQFLDDAYNINSGGCCFVAYCISRLLSRDKFKFKVIVYERQELEENRFSKISGSHSHYAISIKDHIINSAEYDLKECYIANEYVGVKASEILVHYQNGSWNSYYNSTKNQFIFKTIKAFYENLTEDLREG